MPSLASIPLVDVREGGPLQHAHESRERARGLRETCVGWFPAVGRPGSRARSIGRIPGSAASSTSRI
jgi:hypothetical protein